MESEIVRGTHYSEFDDWSEVQMGLEMVRRSLEADPSLVHPDAREFLRDMTEVFARGERNLFVLSLSEDRDSLSQWRGYSHSGGVAIGCKGPSLDVHFREAGKVEKEGGWALAPWQLQQCRYCSPDETIDLISIVSSTDRFVTGIRDTTDCSVRRGMAKLLGASSFSQIEQLCCSIKHHAYATEKEWRCFCTLTEATPLVVQLSEQNRRYVEMPFVAREVVQEVVLSPHGDTRMGRSLAQYFRSVKKLDYTITESTIPFRK